MTPADQKRDLDSSTSTFIQHYTGRPHLCNKARKRNNSMRIVIQTTELCRKVLKIIDKLK